MSRDSTQAAPKPLGIGARSIRLGVLMGADAGRTVSAAVGASATVGTLPENDLVLSDPMVSRVHLEIRPVDEGATVRDLGSLNGTYLGAVRMHEGIVPTGTRIRVGATLFTIDLIGAESAATSGDEPAPAPIIPGLVYASAAMAEIASTVERLAQFPGAVLIQGETGTGKERLATAIHELGPRREGPFVLVDCGSLPPSLLEPELFGHERGAFTGAERRVVGAFERAHGGTLFLDEVGELPLAAQPALLGVLQRGRFRRVGGETEIAVDVRVVSATNRDLRAEVNRGAFRSDLYYRLAGARLVVPPLRERREDIPVLAAHFVAEIHGNSGGAPFSPALIAELTDHYWSGNVRELRNVVETALALGRLELDGDDRAAGHSDQGPSSTRPASTSSAPPEVTSYKEARGRALQTFEREFLTRLITQAAGNASEAARLARMDRPYLLSLLRKHGLR